MSPRMFVLAVAAACAGATTTGASATTQQAVQPLVDIELAFDATASMEPSIGHAKRDAAALVEAARAAVPGARFAVVAFRDPNYTEPEYELLQPLTSNLDSIARALGKLRSARSTSPQTNVPSEAYNLAFRRSYADPALGWRPGARKIVVIIGDAEPHGAGAAGIAGCTNTDADPHGLVTSAELEAMRKAGRTLLLVRQSGSNSDATLECYRSLAARAAPGSAARDTGSANLTKPLLDLLLASYADVRLKPGSRVLVPGGRTPVSVRFSNPNSFAVQLTQLTVTLPAGLALVPGGAGRIGSAEALASGRTLTWSTALQVRPRGAVSVTFSAAASRSTARRSLGAAALVTLPSGEKISTRATAILRVGRSLSVRVAHNRLRGTAKLIFRPGAKSAIGVLSGNGMFATSADGGAVRLAVLGGRVRSLAGPFVTELRVRVVSSSGPARCRPGATGTMRLADAAELTGADTVRLVIRGCALSLRSLLASTVVIR